MIEMKIVLVDHNDSFTYNIVALIKKVSGKRPLVMPSYAIDWQVLQEADKIILSPGSGLPRDFVNMRQILHRFKSTKNILGICLGHQGIATYFGAQLSNMSQVVHGQPKTIHHFNNSMLFDGLPTAFTVGLYHSWVVDRFSFSDQLTITAQTTDGQIMALQHKQYPIFGVQFHPESFISEFGFEIINNFLNIDTNATI